MKKFNKLPTLPDEIINYIYLLKSILIIQKYYRNNRNLNPIKINDKILILILNDDKTIKYSLYMYIDIIYNEGFKLKSTLNNQRISSTMLYKYTDKYNKLIKIKTN